MLKPLSFFFRPKHVTKISPRNHVNSSSCVTFKFSAPKMARLENVITTIVEMFAEYADDQGNKRQLCQQELQALLEKEIESSELKVGASELGISLLLVLHVHAVLTVPVCYSGHN